MYFGKISLRRHHAQTVEDGAFSHDIGCLQFFRRFYILKGIKIASLVQELILLNGWSLRIGVASAVEGLRSTGLHHLLYNIYSLKHKSALSKDQIVNFSRFILP